MNTTPFKISQLPRAAPLTFSSRPCVFAAAFAFLAHCTLAQTWQTVDDFQYVPGQDSQAQGLTVAPNGNLFTCGSAIDALGVSHGLVMASTNGGLTWSSPLDDFIPGGDNTFYFYAGIVADSASNLYVAGTVEGAETNHWIVRRSVDGGATWSTVDDFAPGGFLTRANAISVDSAGNVYVAGDADYANPYEVNYWTVRKGIGGTNFSTVDSVPSGSSFSTAQAILASLAAKCWNGLCGEAQMAESVGQLLTPSHSPIAPLFAVPKPTGSALIPSEMFT